MSHHETLGLTRAEFDELTEHLTHRAYEGIEYRHLSDYRKSVEKGTALVEGTVVRGFPKVPRTLVLGEGVPRHFDGPVAAEEKLDGYNVRVARVDDAVLAFTRSGIVCPFTTHVVESLLDLDAFFESNPTAMLCGEMIGPENPYTAADCYDVDSIAFRAFDVRDRSSGTPLPVRERRELCERFDVPQTELFGVFEPSAAAGEVRRIVRDLDRRGREGVVMKALDGDDPLKYTTSAANQGDLAFAFSLPFDYGRAFSFRRLIREGFQAHEWDETDAQRRERARDLGESILLPMIESIETVDGGDRVCERHTVRADADVVDSLLDHLRDQGLHVEIEADRVEDGERVVTFCKRVQRTNDKIETYLDGTIVRE